METALFWVGGLLALSAVTLAVSAILQWSTALRIRPNQELQTAVSELYTQFADLTDFIQRKEARERVRKMRDGREAKKDETEDAEPPRGTPEHKAWLRRRAGIRRA